MSDKLTPEALARRMVSVPRKNGSAQEALLPYASLLIEFGETLKRCDCWCLPGRKGGCRRCAALAKYDALIGGEK